MTTFSDIQLAKLMKLSNVKGLGPVRIQHLFERFGNIDGIFNAAPYDLLRTKGFTEDMLKEFEKLKDSSDENYLKTIDDCKVNNIKIITIKDSAYPIPLKNIPSPPLILFLWGDSSLLSGNKVAVVGTRSASKGALVWASNFARELVRQKIIIVSGGAKGVDAAAHHSALELNGKTISILGTGFFNLYPDENIPLLQEIKEKGLLISEYSPRFGGSEYSFVLRNRITSGLSDALINVASGGSGGAMVQTKTAFAQKVPIFVPSVSLEILPNDGISYAIEKYGAIEINSAKDFLEKFKSSKL